MPEVSANFTPPAAVGAPQHMQAASQRTPFPLSPPLGPTAPLPVPNVSLQLFFFFLFHSPHTLYPITLPTRSRRLSHFGDLAFTPGQSQSLVRNLISSRVLGAQVISSDQLLASEFLTSWLDASPADNEPGMALASTSDSIARTYVQ